MKNPQYRPVEDKFLFKGGEGKTGAVQNDGSDLDESSGQYRKFGDLQNEVIPEPSTGLLIAGPAILAVFRRRSR